MGDSALSLKNLAPILERDPFFFLWLQEHYSLTRVSKALLIPEIVNGTLVFPDQTEVLIGTRKKLSLPSKFKYYLKDLKLWNDIGRV